MPTKVGIHDLPSCMLTAAGPAGPQIASSQIRARQLPIGIARLIAAGNAHP
jgi:hypothetical protein